MAPGPGRIPGLAYVLVQELRVTDTTPYDEIDPEIRRLVRLMNAFPGIHTTFSCAGHGPHDDAYVAFRADSLEALRELVAALPYYGASTRYTYSHWDTRMVWVDLCPNPADGQLTFSLRLAGDPPHKRDSALTDVETALAARMAPRPKSPPPCSTRGPDRRPYSERFRP